MAYWMSQGGYIYFGDMQPGDRAATGTEITNWQALQPPSLDAGLAIISTGTFSLNGTYSIDAAAQKKINDESLYLEVSVSQGSPQFSNGQITRTWLDINAAVHTFSIPQFVSFSVACAQYLTKISEGIATVQAGGTPVWPTQPVTIP
jgi:hypothetical protein